MENNILKALEKKKFLCLNKTICEEETCTLYCDWFESKMKVCAFCKKEYELDFDSNTNFCSFECFTKETKERVI